MATILVVDDESPTAHLLQTLLEERGHTVIVAYSGQDAISLARERRPDLALIDWMLPPIDGEKLSAMLRWIWETANMPIIIMSAAQSVDWQDAGAVDFLAKPFDVDDALVRIEAQLPNPKPTKKDETP